MAESPSKDKRKVNFQSGMSSWHFAAKQSKAASGKLNKVREVNKVGARYATTPSDADGEQLLKYFHNYLMKYVGLLTQGKLGGDGMSRDTQRFLNLFIPRADYTYTQLTAQYRKVLQRLPNAFMQSMTADDVYNELVIIFFELAQKFNPEIGGFTGYIQNHMRYKVKARMFKVQQDAMNYLPMYEPSLENLDEFDEDQGKNLEPETIHEEEDRFRVEYDYTMEEEEDEEHGTLCVFTPKYIDLPKLNFGFISAPTEPFDELWDKIERTVLVYKYFADLSNSAISSRLRLGGASKVQNIHDGAIRKYREWASINIPAA